MLAASFKTNEIEVVSSGTTRVHEGKRSVKLGEIALGILYPRSR